jgi:iron complex outermembrane receptor protein
MFGESVGLRPHFNNTTWSDELMKFKSRMRLSAIAQALASGALAGTAVAPAWAQQTGTEAAPAKVEITGSRILRVDSETPSPVQIITSQDLQKSGFTTVAEVLQSISANGAGTLSQGFSQAFAGGAAGVSLRGLTTAYTLVLIDGHRVAPYALSDDAQRSFVDVSNLPFDAIDTIEVVKDGAGAVYGSDAIAGTINIKLKKSFTGTRLAADAGTPTEGGGRTKHASVIHGFGDYDADGYAGYVSLEYRHQDRITYEQRAGKGLWNNLDWSGYGGINKTPGVLTPTNPQPVTPSPYLTNPGVSFSGASNSSYFYGGACPSYTALAAGQCAYQSPLAELEPETQNANALLSLSKKLSSNFRLDLKASLFDSEAEQYPAGGLQTYPSALNPIVGVSAGVAPYIATPGISAITVPTTYPGNSFGVPAVVNGVIPDAPIPHTHYGSKASRLAADLTGSIGEWDLSAAIGYSREVTRQDVYGLINVPALNAALNSTAFPFNVTGGNSPSELATIFPSDSVDDISTLSYGEFNANRNLMMLPGGNLQVVGGLSYINRKLNAPAPSLIAEGIVNGNNAYVSGKQRNTAIFAEVQAPVLKTLELDGSVRLDHFDNVGNATTPKFEFKWTPDKQFALRGTVARGFRAPNAAESGQSGTAYLVNTTNDPILCPGGVPASGNIAQGSAIAYCNFQPAYLQGSSQTLKPEKAVTSTLGLIVEPIRGWSSTLDFYQITINNEIVTGQGDINSAVRSPTPVSTLCADGNGGTYTCSVNPILYVPVQYVNANSTKTNGWELGTNYLLHLGAYGTLTTALDWSHTMSYILTEGGESYQLAGTHGPLVVGGDTGNPKDKGRLTFTWDKGPWQTALSFNYLGSFDLTDPSYGVNDCDTGALFGGDFPSGGVPSQFCKVKSFTTTDLSLRYEIGKSWTLKGGVVNLFNTQPPVDLATYGGGQLPFNPSMHMAGAIGRIINVGAIYNF